MKKETKDEVKKCDNCNSKMIEFMTTLNHANFEQWYWCPQCGLLNHSGKSSSGYTWNQNRIPNNENESDSQVDASND